MKRRDFMQVAAVGTGLSCVRVHGAETDGGRLKGSKPNIILVLTDDQGYGDLACHGHPFLKTPNLDNLYDQSTRLTDYHVSPTCAPARAALMTGQYPFRNGITHTILERERMALTATTIAEVLKGAGYTTGIFGKWHLGDEEPYQPHERGFDETFIHGGGGIGQAYPGSCADVPGNRYFDPVIHHNRKFVKTSGYCTDIFFRQALGWIKENRERPFFAYISTNAPHSPFIAPESYRKIYEDKPGNASFYGMITNIDDNVGILMRKLDDWNLSENTLLIFMTDNGTVGGRIYNAGMRGQKNSIHEGGSRAAAFFRLPGKIETGRDIDRLTRHVDIFPTFAELAGAAVPSDIDGRSLLGLIENPKAEWADRYTFFHLGRWGKQGAPGQWGKGDCDPDNAKYKDFAVRSEKWRLLSEDRLFDIEDDPGEKNNVIDQHPEIAKEMLAAYDRWWREMRPLMVNEDVPLASEKPYHVLYQKQADSTGIPDWNAPEI